ncbi:MAG: hypothetical protein LBV08_09610 [Clostridiales bacterium]|jgi:hypothetical protein|nr:hypothetical protein [Clostridiales bacterium]
MGINTSAGELVKINVAAVTITAPPDSSGAQAEASARATEAAQRQIMPGFIAAFRPDSYRPGVLTGKFGVMNNADSSDYAVDTFSRVIAVN